ncbi:MAG: HAD family hydrolase [Gammaproteobacteria bacterium]
MKRLGLLLTIALALAHTAAVAEPLPSWESGPVRSALLDFVGQLTEPDSSTYRPPTERIAVFDHDGTLIVERPLLVQMAFVHERVRELSPAHPEWAELAPFATVLEGDNEVLAEMGFRGTAALVNAAQAGISQVEFRGAVSRFLDQARHPRFEVVYPRLVYQPMLELIALLTASDFRVYIVSSGGLEFIRGLSESVYGVPRDRVVGSVMKYELREEGAALAVWRKTGFQTLNAGSFKVLNIDRHIGRRPLLAVGNSDGDLEMLSYTHAGKGSLAVLLRHDDARREYAYAEDSARVLPVASERDWLVVSMQKDFRQVFPNGDRF